MSREVGIVSTDIACAFTDCPGKIVRITEGVEIGVTTEAFQCSVCRVEYQRVKGGTFREVPYLCAEDFVPWPSA